MRNYCLYFLRAWAFFVLVVYCLQADCRFCC